MGRPLFSVPYVRLRVVNFAAAAPPIEPAAGSASASSDATSLHQYAKWSPENAFDPDSEEFSRDAVYEAFVDGRDSNQHRRSLRLTHDEVDARMEAILSNLELRSSNSSDSSESGRTTPFRTYRDETLGERVPQTAAPQPTATATMVPESSLPLSNGTNVPLTGDALSGPPHQYIFGQDWDTFGDMTIDDWFRTDSW